MNSQMDKKGQISIEFIAYIGLLAIIAILAYFIISSMKTSEITAKEYYLSKVIGDSFVESIGIGVSGGKGFRYTFDVPQMVGAVTTQYTFTIALGFTIIILDIEWEILV